MTNEVVPRYPDVVVQLTGEDGNAFGIVGRVRKALRRAGVPQDDVNEFVNEAMSGDYGHLLKTTMSWVSVE